MENKNTTVESDEIKRTVFNQLLADYRDLRMELVTKLYDNGMPDDGKKEANLLEAKLAFYKDLFFIREINEMEKINED